MIRLTIAALALTCTSLFAADSTGLEIVSKYTAIFNQPPQHVPTWAMVDGPLLGNGDVGVVLAGPPEAQKFYIGKNDFWRRTNAAPEAVGNLTIDIPALQGASYRQEQDMAKAEVRGTFTKGGTTVTMRSWVDANQNLLVTELQNIGSVPVEVSLVQQAGQASLEVPAVVADNDHAIVIGREMHSGGRYYFDGSMANVNIVPRALSADEIRAMAAEQPPVSSAKVFDGKSTYEEHPTIKVSMAVSVSAWIRIESEGEANYIESKGEMGQAYCLGLAGGCVRWMVNGALVQTGQRLDLHKWIHIAATFDGRRMCIFVDGVLTQSIPNSALVDNKLAAIGFTRKADDTPETRTAAVVSRILGAIPRINNGAMAVTLLPNKNLFVASAILSDLDAKDCLAGARAIVDELTPDGLTKLSARHRAWWSDFWSRSFVEIPDKEIEQRWYAALYIMGSCSRAGKVAPGLWGNWSTTDNPEWSGAYFMNYNFMAPYYMAYSSNHTDLTVPFYQAILEGVPNARAMAARHGWKGVHFTVDIGPWGLLPGGPELDQQQRSDAVLMSLPFIWEYQYTQDADFLRKTAYPYLLEVADFWENYLKFENGRYVIYNDAVQENSGSNVNPLLSLSLVHTLFENLISLSEVLSVDAGRRAKWRDICDKLSALPLQQREGQTVFRYSEQGPAWVDSNSIGIYPIFPIGQIGLDSDPKLLEIARNMVGEMHRWSDGGGFSSFYPACARVGYDPKTILEKLRIECATHSYSNLILTYGGGGIENCDGFLAINEMLFQSHDGVLRFFPDWPKDEDARFGTLRARGAFLVSAELKGGVVGGVKIESEKGRDCVVVNPWPGRSVRLLRDGRLAETTKGDRFTFKTRPGEEIVLEPM